ncbi:heavy metal translocating P-type ATPase [Caldiplasma sukawensis]
MPVDPVCGMHVNEDSRIFADDDGQRFYFCSTSCRESFLQPEKETALLKKKLAIAWPLSIIVILLTYIHMESIEFEYFSEMIISIPVIFYCGSQFIKGAYQSVNNMSPNMDLLVAMGSLSAFSFSLLSIFTGIYEGITYFDSACFIVTMILTGNLAEAVSKRRIGRTSRSLEMMMPDFVTKTEGDEIIQIPIESVREGDIIQCSPGDSIPVDGEIIDGKSDVDTSALTGEIIPVTLTKGDHVRSGYINLNGYLKIKSENAGTDSTAFRIFQSIKMATSARLKISGIGDLFSSVFVPIVLIIGVSTGTFWYFYLSMLNASQALSTGVLSFISVIVIACPCAIGLAAPITMLVSSNNFFENGILLANPNGLERLAKTTVVCFDKTGSLTTGQMSVKSFTVKKGQEREILEYVYAAEKHSKHPVGIAINKFCEERGIESRNVDEFYEMPGQGVYARIGERSIKIVRGVEGTSVIIDNEICANFILCDSIREDAYNAVEKLKSMKIKSCILSGDSQKNVEEIASKLNISCSYGGLTPEQKEKKIMEMQKNGEFVTFVGDGLNDGNALAVSDFSVTESSGADISKQSSDAVLLDNRISHVPHMIEIAKLTVRKARQNLIWAILYNSALIPIAAGILVPFTGIYIFTILPVLASFAMGMSSVTVVGNSLLLGRKLKKIM